MAFTLKLGDLLPSFTATLKSAGVAYDLTGNTSLLLAWRPESSTTFATRTLTVVSLAAGTVRYDWQAGDFTVAGHYIGEIRAVMGAKPITFPNSGGFAIEIKGPA